MLFLMALVAVSAAPGREAEALGVRLARTSGIATIAPMMVQKDLTELAKEDPSLSSAQRERLRQIGSAEGQAGIELVVAALGASYAKHLSLRDLRALVKQNESAEAVRRRVAEPSVIMEAMTNVGSMDFKKITAARMCKENGKVCARH
jgi:hypothetical protein